MSSSVYHILIQKKYQEDALFHKSKFFSYKFCNLFY